jgi:predicted nucleotidyltransferase
MKDTPLVSFLKEKLSKYENIGKTFWFEYHCDESDTSEDADLWYHSHQQCEIIKLVDEGVGLTQEERLESGSLMIYSVRFKDGFEGEAFEDEIMESRNSFYRPNPPIK